MAHPLHLARLREGTETWNSWRHRHPEVVADVSEAQLAHLTFDYAHLIGIRTRTLLTLVKSLELRVFLAEVSDVSTWRGEGAGIALEEHP